MLNYLIDSVIKSIYRHQKRRRTQIPVRCPFCNKYLYYDGADKKTKVFSKYSSLDDSTPLVCRSFICREHYFSYGWVKKAISDKKEKEDRKKKEELTLGYFLGKFWR
jgi:hypothetical protein